MELLVVRDGFNKFLKCQFRVQLQCAEKMSRDSSNLNNIILTGNDNN